MSARNRLTAAPESAALASPSDVLGASAPGAPEAPVSRRGEMLAPIAAKASCARHTGPQEAAFGDALRVIAVARKPRSAAKSGVNQRVG